LPDFFSIYGVISLFGMTKKKNQMVTPMKQINFLHSILIT